MQFHREDCEAIVWQFQYFHAIQRQDGLWQRMQQTTTGIECNQLVHLQYTIDQCDRKQTTK